MKAYQLSTLSAAILLATAAQANSFIDDGSLNVELRNHYHDRAKEQGTDKSASQWAQAIRADYSSGYFENIVGIDINAYYALKLGASNIDDANTNNPITPGVLPHDSNGDSDSFGKLGYALKVNLMDMGVVKYGRMYLDTPLLSDSDSRALPSMTEAFYGDITYQGLTAHGVWATKTSSRTDSGFNDYTTKGDDDKYGKEAVKILGAAYDFGNGLTLSADYGTQAGFAKKYLVEGTYNTELDMFTLGLAAQYAKLNTIGAEKASYSDDTSQHAWGVKADVGVQQLTLGLAYTKVQKSQLGYFEHRWMGDNRDMDDTGYFGYNEVQYSHFNRGGQGAIGVSASYDFTGLVNGLSVGGIYVRGKDDPYKSSSEKMTETEYNISVAYMFPQLEGLSAQLRYANNKSEQSGAEDEVVKDTRVIVKYNVAVF